MDFEEEYSLALQSSSDSDEDPVENIPPPVRRRFFESERRDPFLCLTDSEFYTSFAFSKSSFVKLHEIFGEELAPRNDKRTSLSAIEKLLVTLFFLRTNAPNWVVALIGHILRDKSTICRTASSVMEVIASRISEFIALPTPEEEDEIARGFFKIAGFPGVRGVIDGSHFEIRRPKRYRDARDYFNKKQFYSIAMMVLGDDRYLVRHLAADRPGSWHDSATYTSSELREKLKETFDPSSPKFVLGDEAYPCDDELLSPIRFDRVRTPAEANYNLAHKKTRLVIENIFGYVKNKFPVMLQKNRMNDFPKMYNLITSCMILHNCSVLFNDDQPSPSSDAIDAANHLNVHIPCPCNDISVTMRNHVIREHFQPQQ